MTHNECDKKLNLAKTEIKDPCLSPISYICHQHNEW